MEKDRDGFLGRGWVRNKLDNVILISLEIYVTNSAFGFFCYTKNLWISFTCKLGVMILDSGNKVEVHGAKQNH